ncbi:MAG TPA: sulfatase-like hydrolase/transferase [Planctomycetota bacterium]|nr:sulfatase-like hydrolase/transferase [Planctomycetota bacterium]
MRTAWACALAMVAFGAACGERTLDSVVLVTMESVPEDRVSVAHFAWSTTDPSPPQPDAPPSAAIPIDLDDIARLGVRFANAFAPSGSPLASLAGLHTGRPPEEAGVYADFDRLDGMPTLAESLALRGVRCGAFLGRPALARSCGLDRGFHTYLVSENDFEAVREAAAWVERERLADDAARVFVWVHLAGARPPFTPAPEDMHVFEKEVDAGAGTLDSLEAMARDPAKADPARRRDVEALHAAEVRGSARLTAALFLRLAELLNRFDRTLVVFAGTNGEEMGARGPFGSRRTLRDATLHVPLFVWTPGERRGPAVASPLVELADLAATIPRALGCPCPEGCRGRDLFATLRDGGPPDRIAYATWEDRISTVRSSNDRLVCNPLGVVPGGWPAGPLEAPREELYDVSLDPREQRNLAAEPSERLERMRAALVRARASVRPRPPRPDDDPYRRSRLELEGTHKGDAHPPGAPSAATCGGRE